MTARPLTAVDLPPMPLDRYAAVLCADQLEAVQAGVLAARSAFAGRTIWNVSSTAQGGGVAEMLKTLLPYARGAGVDARWRVIGAGPEFFAVTKRIHNRLHGFAGDGGPLGDAEREQYEAALAPCAAALTEIVNARDIVILHDPQTVGLAPALSDLGVSTIWRCHVGVDQPNEIVRETWSFLEPYVHATRAAVFSRAAFVWSGVDRAHVSVIMPTLDAFAPKNQALEPAAVAAILHAAGIRLGAPSARALYERRDGSEGIVGRRALVVEDRPLRHGEAYVLQVSRWDALKDHAGVIAGFAEHVAPTSEAHLVCAGPEIDGVSDDPEGARVLADVIAAHARLDPAIRERVHLAVLPMDDPQENAATVNALQRAAAIVVQKSIAEGFGLTVAEAMWKARPVIASRIGGIQDQIEDGRSGLLLDDARDLEAFGAAVRRLLADSEEAETLASAARERVRERFLAPRSLLDYLKVLETVAGA